MGEKGARNHFNQITPSKKMLPKKESHPFLWTVFKSAIMTRGNTANLCNHLKLHHRVRHREALMEGRPQKPPGTIRTRRQMNISCSHKLCKSKHLMKTYSNCKMLSEIRQACGIDCSHTLTEEVWDCFLNNQSSNQSSFTLYCELSSDKD